MSRHGFNDDYDCYDTEDFLRQRNWRGALMSATRGKRGQAFFRALVAALDAMPEKRLIRGKLTDSEGSHCALGCLGAARGLDMSAFDVEDDDEWDDDDDCWDWDRLGAMFDIAPHIAQEVMWVNDDGTNATTPEDRWVSVRRWAARQIRVTPEELEPLP